MSLITKPNEKEIKLIKFVKQYYDNHYRKNETEILDRFVFISLFGLFRFWDEIPPLILEHSLLILPIKECWLYKKYKKDENILYKYDMYKNKDFINILKYKNYQSLIIFTKDYQNCTNNIADVWYVISNKLMTLFHTKTLQYYNGINFQQILFNNSFLYYNNCDNYNNIKSILLSTNNNLSIIVSKNDFDKYNNYKSINLENKYMCAKDPITNSLWWINSDYFD